MCPRLRCNRCRPWPCRIPGRVIDGDGLAVAERRVTVMVAVPAFSATLKFEALNWEYAGDVREAEHGGRLGAEGGPPVGLARARLTVTDPFWITAARACPWRSWPRSL